MGVRCSAGVCLLPYILETRELKLSMQHVVFQAQRLYDFTTWTEEEGGAGVNIMQTRL